MKVTLTGGAVTGAASLLVSVVGKLLVYVPGVLEVTFTKIVQVLPTGRVPFEKAIDVPFAITLSTPPQLLMKKRGGAITSPAGKLSVKARPVRGVAVLLMMVKVKGAGALVAKGVPGNALVKTGEVGPTTRVTVPLCAGAWELVRVTGGLT
jgi:hypothetical protein